MGQSQIGEVLTRVSGLPSVSTYRHPECSQKPFAKGRVLPLAVPEGPGLDLRSPSVWVLRPSIQNGGSRNWLGCAAVGGPEGHDVGSLHQVSCDQAGGRAVCLLMLGLGPGQCKHSPRPFPPPAESPSPASLWRPDSWQPGWGPESCRIPSPIDRRECPSTWPQR